MRQLSKLLLIIKQLDTLVLIISAVLVPLIFGDYLSTYTKSVFYTLSHSIKTILLFFLPLLISPFIIRSVLQVQVKGAYFITATLLLVFLSNFASIMIAYCLGTLFIKTSKIGSPAFSNITEEVIGLVYSFELPNFISISQSMLISIIIGALVNYKKSPYMHAFIESCVNCSKLFFEKIFINIIPLYVFGTMLKTMHEIDFLSLLPIFSNLLLIILATTIFYISLLFFIGTNLDLGRTIISIKNALPASIVGFSTMSSLVTMPITLKAAEKNTKNVDIAQMTVSTTVNCHDIGDCIALPLLTLAIYYITNGSFPILVNYIHFALMVALLQFSAVSVPGGSIAIILPSVIQQFGFTDEMTSLLIALSVCVEPFGTAGNVMGNSAFAILIDNLYSKINCSQSNNINVVEDNSSNK